MNRRAISALADLYLRDEVLSSHVPFHRAQSTLGRGILFLYPIRTSAVSSSTIVQAASVYCRPCCFESLVVMRCTEVDTKSPAPATNAKTLSPLLDPFLGGCRTFGANLRIHAVQPRFLKLLLVSGVFPTPHRGLRCSRRGRRCPCSRGELSRCFGSHRLCLFSRCKVIHSARILGHVPFKSNGVFSRILCGFVVTAISN